MRYVLIALLVGCGGADCDWSKPHEFTATLMPEHSSCKGAPATFPVTVVSANNSGVEIVENGVPISAHVFNAVAGCSTFASAGTDVVHNYVLSLDGRSTLYVATMGVCTSTYDLRR